MKLLNTQVSPASFNSPPGRFKYWPQQPIPLEDMRNGIKAVCSSQITYDIAETTMEF
jgi:hypothetical protein